MANGTIPTDNATYRGYSFASYISNAYAGKTSVERIHSYKFGTFAFVVFNLALDASMPSPTDFVTIGNLGFSLKGQFLEIVLAQNGAGHMLVQLLPSGDIRIANTSGTTLSDAFHRAIIPVVLG